MTTFQPPRATKIEHLGADTSPRCRICGRVLEGGRMATKLCREHQLEERATKSRSISLSLEEIQATLESFAKRPPTTRERAPWPDRSKGARSD